MRAPCAPSVSSRALAQSAAGAHTHVRARTSSTGQSPHQCMHTQRQPCTCPESVPRACMRTPCEWERTPALSPTRAGPRAPTHAARPHTRRAVKADLGAQKDVLDQVLHAEIVVYLALDALHDLLLAHRRRGRGWLVCIGCRGVKHVVDVAGVVHSSCSGRWHSGGARLGRRRAVACHCSDAAATTVRRSGGASNATPPAAAAPPAHSPTAPAVWRSPAGCNAAV
eukprot:365555-Chlamydomonas_euryale.AAC.6